jgi:hypothetical protein
VDAVLEPCEVVAMSDQTTFAALALASLTLAAVTSTTSSAVAQEAVHVEPPPPLGGPPPPSGLGLIITGGIFTGIGAVNLLTSPICKSSFVDPSISDVCLGVSLGIGGAFVAIGIPMLVVGTSRRSEYLEWRRRNAAAALLDVRLARVAGGGVATWQATF